MNAPHNPAQARAWRKRTAAVFAAVGALVFSSGIVMLTAPAASAATKIGVCHRTANDQNPYRFETVGEAAFNAPKGHATHLSGASAVATWESAGVWNGIEHLAGGSKPDYILGSDGVPDDVTTVEGLRTWCLAGQTGGTLVEPEYEPNGACGVHGWISEPFTLGVTYSIAPGDWDVTSGTHTITATLDDKSAKFSGDVGGWTITGKTARFEVILGDYAGDCAATLGELATLDWSAADGCTPGHVTEPGDTQTVDYTISPGGWTATEGDHTVTATLIGGATGFADSDAAEADGWTIDGNKATREIHLGTVTCSTPTPVTPLEPKWVEAKCASNPAVEYREVEGVRYTTVGDVSPGASVVVTAAPVDDHYVLADGSEHEFPHTFKAKPSGAACDDEVVTPPSSDDTPAPPIVIPNPELIPVTPNYAEATEATCSQRGALIVPNQPAGVRVSRTGSVPGTVIFTYAPKAGYAFPDGTVTQQSVTVEKKLEGDACILGDEEVKPTHTGKPTHHAKPKPRDRGPVVLGTQAAVPTAVDAGLGSLPTAVVSSTGSPRLAQALVAGGLLMLVAGGSMGLGRRTRGAHES